MGLILLGGLGMPVARELLGYRMTRSPLFRRFAYFQRMHDGKLQKPLSLQTKLSLWMTGALLLLGFIGFWILEYDGVLAGYSAGDSALIASFQSVTTRTAGFSSVSMGDMQEGTKMMFLGLMSIGAGPVSTGGGLKTVAFAVLLVALRAMVTGRKNIEVAGRSIPRLIVRTALSVFVLYVLAAGFASFALAISDPQIAFSDRAFETISALGTVGLSTGVTTEFSLVGQFVLCLTMFAGRIGPLALTLSVFRSRSATAAIEYPEEDLIVG
jgi:trk system potassium uptake protein TrkH